jgi:GNAT superfamily N-acetyltransferase
MTTATAPSLVIRDALDRDAFAVTRVLTAAFAGNPLAAACASDPSKRERSSMEYIGGLVASSIDSGICRLARHGDEILGAALWSMYPGLKAKPSADLVTRSPVPATTSLAQGLRRQVRAFADSRRAPGYAYQQLEFIGVRPDRQGRGIGSLLLNTHHAVLSELGTPAFAVTTDDRMQRLLQRHGYSAIGPSGALPSGVQMSAMWRPPVPALAILP